MNCKNIKMNCEKIIKKHKLYNYTLYVIYALKINEMLILS